MIACYTPRIILKLLPCSRLDFVMLGPGMLRDKPRQFHLWGFWQKFGQLSVKGQGITVTNGMLNSLHRDQCSCSFIHIVDATPLRHIPSWDWVCHTPSSVRSQNCAGYGLSNSDVKFCPQSQLRGVKLLLKPVTLAPFNNSNNNLFILCWCFS